MLNFKFTSKNSTLTILIATFSCQIPTTYAMFYKKRILCSHTVWSTLRTVWYDAPPAGFSKIDPRPLSDSDNAILGALVIEGKIFREALTDIGRQVISLQENFNESKVQPIEQPIRGTGSHSDNLLLLNVGFCLDYGACLVYSLYYLISWYFVNAVTVN